MIESTDITFVLSGGSGNASISNSLGGEPSNTAINDSINNLFSDISSAEAENGKTDYRCFYVFNDSETDTLYNAKIYIKSQTDTGAECQLGLKKSDDIQIIYVSSTEAISSGTVTFNLEGNIVILYYDDDLSDMQQSFEDSINSFSNLEATVVVDGSSSDFSLSVTFGGGSGNKYYEKFVVVSNDIITAGTVAITVDKVANGSPVNTFSASIDNEAVAPNGVVFQFTSSLDDSLSLADLGPGEGFPVWVKRTTTSDSEAIQNDNFTFLLAGNPV